ncbi:hypothetical protein MBLNU457_g0772t1 [Dothideomycetes sp. NU457]
MGQPRGRRRAVVVISSDEEDGHDDTEDLLKEESIEDTKSTAKTTTRSKAKVVKQSKADPTTTPHGSQSSQQSSKASKPDTKKSKGTIFSFFNAATQKQQSSQPPAGSQKPVKAAPLVEDIDDAIDENDMSIELTNGSKTALTHRKRKFGIEQFATGESPSTQSSSQKFRKATDGAKVVARPQIEDKRPWTEQYGPVDLSELAVHKKKVSDVRALLEEAVSVRARPRVIVLKGAAGTGKTATVQLLAKDMGLQVKEWRNPGSVDFGSENSSSASVQFEDFILRSGKYTGLDLVSADSNGVESSRTKDTESSNKMDNRSQVMLIEEFPNTFAKSSSALQSFRSTIQQYLAMPRVPNQTTTPIIMIISETLLSTSTAASDSFTAHRLLGPAILTHPLTVEVEFNPIATTFLTKALELVVVKEARKSGRRKTPGPQVLKQLAETGDVRSAVSSLEFLCLRGDDEDAWSGKVAFSKPKGKASKTETALTKQEKEALELISNRESTLGIFHSVGKVVYNKRTDPPSGVQIPQPPSHLPQHRRPKLPETDADALIMELGTDTPTFVAALHENFALSCATTMADDTMDSLNGCLESLSDADMLAPDRFGQGSSGSTADRLRQDEISFQVAVRGLLFNLPYPVKRDAGAAGRKGDAFRMFYPTSLKIWKRQEEIEGMLETVGAEYANMLGVNAVVNSAKKEGVEGWRRNAEQGLLTPADSSEAQDNDVEVGTKPLLLTSSAKQEMLIERLPYMRHIQPSNASSSFRERINTITALSGHGVNANEEEAEDTESPDMIQSEWTDRPDADGEIKPRRKIQKGKKTETEGGGLNIPVEHAVGKLVLSDDDIED